MNGTSTMSAVLLLSSIATAGAGGFADAPPGAASCTGCHPANRSVESNVPSLTGRNPPDVVAAMAAFKSDQLPSTVMGRIAKGFSDDEIRAIAAWYGVQKE